MEDVKWLLRRCGLPIFFVQKLRQGTGPSYTPCLRMKTGRIADRFFHYIVFLLKKRTDRNPLSIVKKNVTPIAMRHSFL